MKKILLKGFILLSAIMFSANVKAQWIEGFNSTIIPTGWNTINGGGPATWKFNMSSNPAGHAMITWENNDDLAHDDYLITPAITVTAGVSDYLKFITANESASYIDVFDIWVSTSGIAATDFSFNLSGDIGPGVSWETYEFDLSAYHNQTIYIAFHAKTADPDDQNLL